MDAGLKGSCWELDFLVVDSGMNGRFLVVGERPKVPAATGPSEQAGPRSGRAPTTCATQRKLEQYSAELTCSCPIDEMNKIKKTTLNTRRMQTRLDYTTVPHTCNQ